MVGILLSVSILFLQIRNYFTLQQKITQGDVLYSFKSDIEETVNNVISSTGNSYINYIPTVKKYTLILNDGVIEIKDALSGKSTVFSVNFESENSVIEDSEYICISKVRDCEKDTYVLRIKKGFCEENKADCIKYDKYFEGQPISGGDCPDLEDNCATGEVVFQKIACEAKKAGVPPSIMIGIAMTESGGKHCDNQGNVKLGDGGRSIGLMQTSQCSDTGDVRNINENIRCSIKILLNKCTYSNLWIIRNDIGRCNPTGYCTDNGVKCEYCYNVPGINTKTYYGWDIAIRGYNGWGSCGVDANYNYVETVKKYAAQYKNYD